MAPQSEQLKDASPGEGLVGDSPPPLPASRDGVRPQRQRPKTTASPADSDALTPPPSSLFHKLVMTLAVGAPLLGTVIGIALLWQFGWMNGLYLALLVVGWLATGMGITIGFHRLATHRSFETYRPVRAFWVALGALSVEGSPLVWCAVHRQHHARSDQPGDPHSPHLHGRGWWNALCGFWYAHAGWLFTGYWSRATLRRYVPDLMADPWIAAIDRWYGLWVLLSLVAPAAIGGLATGSWSGVWLGLLWGGLVRIFLTHHITWSINSICHLFGSRDYEAHDHSRNNWLCGILGHGEGWHNNHHAFPTSARHGLQWWQLDTSWLVICAMQAVGLAWNVRLPSAEARAGKRL